MKGFILGFQRLTWWPKCDPASSRSTKEISKMDLFCIKKTPFSAAGVLKQKQQEFVPPACVFF